MRASRVLLGVSLVLCCPVRHATSQGTGAPGVGIFLPFNANQTWYVCQGYLGPITHGVIWAFDLTRDPAGIGNNGCDGDLDYSAGEEVLAPGPGVASDPAFVLADDMVCLDLDDGGSLLIGHMVPNTRRLGRVAAGEVLGIVAVNSGTGDNDNVNNGNYAHIHIDASTANNCARANSVPFTGQYKFHGVPPLPNLRPISAEPNYINHYFGMGLSNLVVDRNTDDAGTHPVGCVESTSSNEIYLGNCANGPKIWSGWVFRNLPLNQHGWVSAAALLFKTDGPYNSSVSLVFRSEASSRAASFSSTDMPIHRQNRLTTATAGWVVSDVWALGMTRETPSLRTLLQPVVDRPDWSRNQNSVAMLVTSTRASSNVHRRVIARERDATHENFNLYPGRLVVTQYRTSFGGDADGNNPPVAKAGADLIQTFPNQRLFLNGTASFDPDGDGLSYQWRQVAGPPAAIAGGTSATPTVTLGPVGDCYTFALTVTDSGRGRLMNEDQVVVSCAGCC